MEPRLVLNRLAQECRRSDIDSDVVSILGVTHILLLKRTLQEEITDNLSDFAARLKSAMARRNLTLREIGAALGKSTSAVGAWTQGKNWPEVEALRKLADVLEVSVEFLLEGKSTRPGLTDKVQWVSEDSGSLENAIVADDPVAIGDHSMRTVAAFAMAGGRAAIPLRMIPVISWTQAGQLLACNQMPDEWRETVPTVCVDPKAYAIALEGDAMEPRYYAGQKIVVMPGYEPRNHGLVVAKLLDESLVFKRYSQLPKGRVRLTSYNSAHYEPVELEKNAWRWIYPVWEVLERVHAVGAACEFSLRTGDRQ